ncbi:MAG: alanine racemase [Akkermansia sp.]|nr:alanine racemase [Akkermansia sp.]
MIQESPPRAWVEVNLEAIAHNLDVARQALPDTALMPVIKAGAYGHGLEPVARRLDTDGIAFFGVANAGEARRLSRAGVRTKPFILGPTFPEEREEIVLNNWCATISTLEEAAHFNRLAELYDKTFLVHLTIDTGMGREGFLPQQLQSVVETLPAMQHLRVDGVMSHFPSADEDVSYTQDEIGLFTDCVQQLQQHFRLRYRHIAASAGELGYEVPIANLARPGLLLYGVAPMASIYDGLLKPTLRLSSRVSLVRELPAGHGVAYGRTYITEQPTRVATIGIGYADGWPRSISGKGARVYINGHFCPMLGRVTMDQIMADVTHVPFVEPGDEVELIGPHIPITEVAEKADTIVWTIFTGLGPRLPRVYSA